MSAESVIAEFIAAEAGISAEEALPQALDLIETLAEAGYVFVGVAA